MTGPAAGHRCRREMPPVRARLSDRGSRTAPAPGRAYEPHLAVEQRPERAERSEQPAFDGKTRRHFAFQDTPVESLVTTVVERTGGSLDVIAGAHEPGAGHDRGDELPRRIRFTMAV